MSRQAYYQASARTRTRTLEVRNSHIVEQVMGVRRTQPRLGTRKLQHVLRAPLAEAGVHVGRDALFDILRQARLLVVPRRAYHKTTNSHHRFYRHPNLLKEGPQQQRRPDGCEQVWVADITYLPTQGSCVYLSLITDAWSRRIVGHHVHESLHARHVSEAFKWHSRAVRQSRHWCIIQIAAFSTAQMSTRKYTRATG